MAIDFYKNLKPSSEFQTLIKSGIYSEVPHDWWVIITDVVNSTKAITSGQYKEVNTAGAVAIVAIANQDLHEYIPLIFGGDGITLLTPGEFLGSIKDIFHGTRDFVKRNFNLDLRIGIVPVREIKEAGHSLFLAKFSKNDPFQQAIFSGSGFDFAENLVKGQGGKYLLQENHESHLFPDFSGFACPFREIKSEGGSVLAVIIKPGQEDKKFQNSVVEFLELLGDEREYYPISFQNLKPQTTSAGLRAWVTVASGSSKGFKNWILGKWISLYMKIGSSMIHIEKRTSKYIPLNSDHKKYDGGLKMVIRCIPEKRSTILNWLKEKEEQNQIHFGIFETDAILVTCVLDRNIPRIVDRPEKNSKAMHLIDAANGGYALAAKMLKEKLSKKNINLT